MLPLINKPIIGANPREVTSDSTVINPAPDAPTTGNEDDGVKTPPLDGPAAPVTPDPI